MLLDKSSPWGEERVNCSSGVLTIILINSLFVAFFFFFSGMHSFLGLPMFGDEMETSPKAKVMSTLILMVVFDIAAVWRFIRLSRRWSSCGWNKVFLWFYQIVFVGVAGYSNSWMFTVVWFWWGR